MADVTIHGLVNELAAPTANDEVGIWNLITSRYEKIKRSNLVGANITGGGTIALGGFTLTVPVSGTAALLAALNVFTVVQTIAPSGGAVDGLLVNMQASNTASGVKVQYNSVNRFSVLARATQQQAIINAADLGADNLGPGLIIGHNSASLHPAASYIRMSTRAGVDFYLWFDSAGKLRKGSTPPDFTNDGGGIIVGTET